MPTWRRIVSWILLLSAAFLAIPSLYLALSALFERDLGLLNQLSVVCYALLVLGFPAWVLLVIAALIRR